jgi:hypothetical protein
MFRDRFETRMGSERRREVMQSKVDRWERVWEIPEVEA